MRLTCFDLFEVRLTCFGLPISKLDLFEVRLTCFEASDVEADDPLPGKLSEATDKNHREFLLAVAYLPDVPFRR